MVMKHNDDELEKMIHRELNALPQFRAPETLMPRVMAAVANRTALPWYVQPCYAWPRWVQFIAGIASIVLVILIGMMVAWIGNSVSSHVHSDLAGVSGNARAWAGIVWSVWTCLLRGILPYVAAGTVGLTLIVIGLGRTAVRLAIIEHRT